MTALLPNFGYFGVAWGSHHQVRPVGQEPMVPYLRSIAPAVASADGATGVPDGGSCYANTFNSGPTWAASQRTCVIMPSG